MYVAFDGNYGDEEGLVIVDNTDFDDHFYNYLDYCSDWHRPSFAEWFRDNEHTFTQTDEQWECEECETYLSFQN